MDWKFIETLISPIGLLGISLMLVGAPLSESAAKDGRTGRIAKCLFYAGVASLFIAMSYDVAVLVLKKNLKEILGWCAFVFFASMYFVVVKEDAKNSRDI